MMYKSMLELSALRTIMGKWCILCDLANPSVTRRVEKVALRCRSSILRQSIDERFALLASTEDHAWERFAAVLTELAQAK